MMIESTFDTVRSEMVAEEADGASEATKPDLAERIDDLQCRGYQIIQNRDMFCFGMDAVLLANYVRIKRGGRFLDLGTGTGIIPILLSAKEYGDDTPTREQRLSASAARGGVEVCMSGAAYEGCGGKNYGRTENVQSEVASDTVRFVGVELQPACAEMAQRSVRLNGLEDLVRIDCGDIKEVPENYQKNSFDVVTSNPPYIKGSHGLENPDAPKNIARHEVHVTLRQVIEAAAYTLKPGGSFYMIHKPFRLVEIFAELRDCGLEPKRMQMVHPYIDREPNMVIVEAVKGGNPMIKIDPPMIVYKEPNVYTEQLLATYEGAAKTDKEQ